MNGSSNVTLNSNPTDEHLPTAEAVDETLDPNNRTNEESMTESVTVEQTLPDHHPALDEQTTETTFQPVYVDVEERLETLARVEQELNQRENLVIPVKDLDALRTPQSVKDWSMTNAMVQPTYDGKLYVQVSPPP